MFSLELPSSQRYNYALTQQGIALVARSPGTSISPPPPKNTNHFWGLSPYNPSYLEARSLWGPKQWGISSCASMLNGGWAAASTNGALSVQCPETQSLMRFRPSRCWSHADCWAYLKKWEWKPSRRWQGERKWKELFPHRGGASRSQRWKNCPTWCNIKYFYLINLRGDHFNHLLWRSKLKLCLCFNYIIVNQSLVYLLRHFINRLAEVPVLWTG